MAPLTELSLFSGAGGGLLAAQHLLGWRTVCYVEWDRYAVEVLKARIRDGYLHDAPIWDDAFTFDGHPWAGLVDVVSAGFPCQPFSVAGKGLAGDDPRNGWPATIRIIREVRPRIAWLENVPGLLAKPYFGTILGELAEAGYGVKWDCVSAQEVGAPHLRERLWIVAHADGWPWYVAEQFREEGIHASGDGAAQQVADPSGFGMGERRLTENAHETDGERRDHAGGKETYGHRCEEVPNSIRKRRQKLNPSRVAGDAGQPARLPDPRRGADWWTPEPGIQRVVDGVAFRMDRLSATGNGQVPAVVRDAWERLTK